ncbi:MAG: hypothetical protein JW720_04340 [Sedimentisphaerales bacterium]|nr:hypothetical protein [Sedimentisphaerales bacterium]
MSTGRLHLIVLASVILLQSQVVTGGLFAAETVAKTGELDPQLKLTKDALLDKGSSDQMRANAATVMLLSENPLARGILLDALKQTENSAVLNAVCKALIQAGTGKAALRDAGDFIEPLFGVMGADNRETARLGAEATLIFDYEQISAQIDRMISDAATPLQAKLVAIYALELRPDMRAAVALLRLVDNPQKEISETAQEALSAVGIECGDSPAVRADTIRQLIAEGPTIFLQKRLIRKESLIRNTKVELALWQGRYLQALGDVYASISDDAEKAKFLSGHLEGSETVVRLWTLERIRQDRVGTRPNPKLPEVVGPVLVKLVADGDRNVRLKTADVLSFMTEVDSAQMLLAQLEAEQDDQVKTAIFSALGRACYIAFLPNSKINIAPEIRKKTLEWAVKYLSDETAAKTEKGAEVLRMLLEQDGLTNSEADKHFALLADRYAALKSDSDGTLRGELLSAMSALCAPQSMHKAQSRKRFGPFFEAALSDKTDFVREAAVDGLIHIDKAAALKRLAKDFVADPSIIIRKKLIALAAEVGGKEDLAWLAGKIGSNSESEPAWQAMLKIFNGAEAEVLSTWVGIFTAEAGSIQASDSQKITFLEVAKRKAVAENKPAMLQNVQEKLAGLYLKTGQYEQAASYLGGLYVAASTEEFKKAILPDLLYAYLMWPKVDLAGQIVENRLIEADIDPNDAVVRSLDEYLARPPAGADPNLLVAALTKIKTPAGRPLWQNWLRDWAARFRKPKLAGGSTGATIPEPNSPGKPRS